MLEGITSQTVPTRATGEARGRAFFLHWGDCDIHRSSGQVSALHHSTVTWTV